MKMDTITVQIPNKEELCNLIKSYIDSHNLAIESCYYKIKLDKVKIICCPFGNCYNFDISDALTEFDMYLSSEINGKTEHVTSEEIDMNCIHKMIYVDLGQVPFNELTNFVNETWEHAYGKRCTFNSTK